MLGSLNLQVLRDLYNSTMAQADPRADSYPLMDSPRIVLMLVGLYLTIVILGPKWMEHRKPWDLRKTIVIYNFCLVILSTYITLQTIHGIYKAGGYSIACDTMDKYQVSESNEIEYFYINVGYTFFLSKIIEFWDTFFFVLRKKNRQITFLHVYHHATMAIFTWLGVKFLPGGTNIVYPLINSFIHAVMYTYYGLAACGPSMAKYLWWKKYLTKMQISQFLIFLGQGYVNYYYNCPLPKVFVYAVYIYTFSILVLFINFYVRAYLSKSKRVESNGKVKKLTEEENHNNEAHHNHYHNGLSSLTRKSLANCSGDATSNGSARMMNATSNGTSVTARVTRSSSMKPI